MEKIKVKNYVAVAHSKRGAAGSGIHNNKKISIKKGSSRKVKHKGRPKGESS
jgi:hypothetical protein